MGEMTGNVKSDLTGPDDHNFQTSTPPLPGLALRTVFPTKRPVAKTINTAAQIYT